MDGEQPCKTPDFSYHDRARPLLRKPPGLASLLEILKELPLFLLGCFFLNVLPSVPERAGSPPGSPGPGSQQAHVDASVSIHPCSREVLHLQCLQL